MLLGTRLQAVAILSMSLLLQLAESRVCQTCRRSSTAKNQIASRRQFQRQIATTTTIATAAVSDTTEPRTLLPVTETFIDLVRSTGYYAEEYNVTTSDGYILTIHRMPGSPKKPPAANKPVVLMVHGLLAASDIWVLRGPSEDLAFMLVDAGYDVWFMNTRGNFYGRRHKRLTPKDSKFWRFSWHESGMYDMPATIDYVLTATGQKKLSMVGHSMGTTMALVLLSLKPEYNAKVEIVVSFAPIAIFTHLLPGPVNTMVVRYGKQLQKTLKALGINEVFPRNPTLLGLYATICQTPKIEILCQKFALSSAGLLKSSSFDAFHMNVMNKVLRHYPQGSSLETLLHYRQILMSGKFRQYDFGPERNYMRYKNVTPPEYPIEKITVPFVLYYGMNDAYTTKEDVHALMSRLKIAEGKEVQHDRFSHLDFLLSNLTKPLVYRDVMHAIEVHHRGKPSSSSPATAAAASSSAAKASEYGRLAPSTVAHLHAIIVGFSDLITTRRKKNRAHRVKKKKIMVSNSCLQCI
uniref:Partial AB-hydrolase lipase domain-containing protein n=1 Tax=Trichogramma kaykai TaxID=54128 RepID=A0ABD2WEA3_9HYME